MIMGQHVKARHGGCATLRVAPSPAIDSALRQSRSPALTGRLDYAARDVCRERPRTRVMAPEQRSRDTRRYKADRNQHPGIEIYAKSLAL